jgi:predicted alpha/beta superfamily hydrolase
MQAPLPQTATPPAQPRTPEVIKHDGFQGRLSERAIYIYLPPGYHDDTTAHYPVIYMHDGQNVFETYKDDSFAGVSWQADLTANALIAQGAMRPCLIVAVANGREQRMAEYMPPYAYFRHTIRNPKTKKRKVKQTIYGMADTTFRYYAEDVAGFVRSHYRVLTDRAQTATVGSSMGGLFSTYIALTYPHFARHHAALSPAYWVTNQGRGQLGITQQLSQAPKRDIRLWLDSGEGRNIPGGDDDNKFCTLEMYEALLAAGYTEGADFQYFLAEGAKHHEADWAARLDRVFRFLMPA